MDIDNSNVSSPRIAIFRCSIKITRSIFDFDLLGVNVAIVTSETWTCFSWCLPHTDQGFYKSITIPEKAQKSCEGRRSLAWRWHNRTYTTWRRAEHYFFFWRPPIRSGILHMATSLTNLRHHSFTQPHKVLACFPDYLRTLGTKLTCSALHWQQLWATRCGPETNPQLRGGKISCTLSDAITQGQLGVA